MINAAASHQLDEISIWNLAKEVDRSGTSRESRRSSALAAQI